MPNKVYTDHESKMIKNTSTKDDDYELVPELELAESEARCLEVFEALYD